MEYILNPKKLFGGGTQRKAPSFGGRPSTGSGAVFSKIRRYRRRKNP